MSRRIVFVLLALVAFSALSGCQDSRARVIFDNQSECGVIAVQLINSQTNEIASDRIAPGEKREFEVKPDVYYRYTVDFTAAGTTPDNYRCTSVEEGQVRVPAGTSQTFVLQSEKQTPQPTGTP